MITLKTDGKLYRTGNAMDVHESMVEVDGDLILYLSESFEIEDGVTFSQFMLHLFQHWQTYSMVFSSHLGHYSLGVWLDEFNKPIPETKDNDIEYLEVAHVGIEINASGPNKFNDNDVEIYDTFHGWGPYEVHPDGAASMGGFGIEYTALNELKKYPLKLNKEVVFIDANTYKSICKMKKYFTVYDVISAILYEISWCGSPDQRITQWEEMIDRVKKYDKEKEKKNE